MVRKPIQYTPEELAEANLDPLPPQDDLDDLLNRKTSGQETKKDAPKAEPKPEIPPTRYQEIEWTLRDKKNTARLAVALGHGIKETDDKTEAIKYISSVLTEIKKTECAPAEKDNKLLQKDLTLCTTESILQAIIDAANFRLPIDGRKLAYLVKYGDKASFQPGYKGFLYKIAEHYRDVDFTAEPVFEGDTLTLSDEGGFQTYKHIRANPFQTDQNKMQGLIACLSYNGESGRHSKVATLAKSEIDQIRRAAKHDFIWNAWFFEKAKAAGLKRLCKIHFATVMGVQELVQYDNEQHFVIDNTPNGDKITPSNSAVELSKMLDHAPADIVPTVITTTQKETANVENN